MEDKIILRKLSLDDAYDLSRLANNKNIWNNMRDIFPNPYNPSDAANFISMVSEEDPQLTFAIEYDYHFAGVISFIKQQDIYRKNVEIGFWIGEEYWNKGIITTSIKKIVNYAFENLDVNRIFARVFDYNIGSMKALEKNNFIKESISINAIIKNNNFHHLHNYSLLI